MRYCRLCLLLSSVLLCAGLRAEVVSNHISNPRITCFEQDAHGRMWIGTERGLNRFNGYDYHQYLNPDIPGNVVNDILCDTKGRIWVGTDKGVAVYSDNDGFRTIRSDSNMEGVLQILEDGKGRIFINKTEDLYVLDTLENRFVPATLLFDRYLQYHQKCYIQSDSLMWVVGALEIRCFNTVSMENVDNTPVPSTALFSALFDNGIIVFGGGRKFYWYDTNTCECRPMKNLDFGEDVERIDQISGNTAILKTKSGKTFHLNGDTLEQKEIDLGLPDNFNLTEAYLDKSGNLWLGSTDENFIVNHKIKSRFTSDSKMVDAFRGKPIVSIDSDSKGNLWAFNRNGELFLYDRAIGELKQMNGIGEDADAEIDLLQKNKPVLKIDGYDRLWLAFPDQRKFSRFSYENGTLRRNLLTDAYYPKDFVTDSNGNTWVILNNETLMKVDGQNGRTSIIQVFPWNDSGNQAALSIGNRMLISSNDGNVAWVNIDNNVVNHLGRGSFVITCMALDGSNVWIGTRNNGIAKFDIARNSVEFIPGCPCSEISSIEISSDGVLWIGTPDGLLHFSPEDNAFVRYSKDDGTGGDCFLVQSSCKLDDGRIIFGGTHGITMVDPSVRPDETDNDFVFEDIRTNDNTLLRITGKERAELNHNQNSFTVSFAAINHSGQKHTHYHYCLEGYDKGWIDAGYERTALYANLRAGKYTFKVSYDDKQKSIDIRIKPSFWASKQMWIIYILFFSMLCAYLVNVRRNIAREKAALSAERAEKEMEKRQKEMNLRFFSNISHEFRTPLTMISGPVEQLCDSPNLGRKEKKMLSITRKSIDRMLALVNQILDFGKLENDTLKLKVSSANIGNIILAVCEPFKLNMKEKGIRLNVSCPSDAIGFADEDKLIKILSNLLSNAFKFTPSGGTVTVDAQRYGSRMKITVMDTGPGIPEDQLEAIFERYYQVQPKNGGSYGGGTGIGLYFARSLARIHHGDIIASNSQQGSGAVFTFDFPLDASSYSNEETGLPSDCGPMETVPRLIEGSDENQVGSKARVMVVDDDQDMLRYLKELLSFRYEVTSCPDADSALSAIDGFMPDLILSDVIMPGKDGFEFCRILKENLQTCHIPVILVTAKGTVDNQVEGLDSGADAYVTKPFSPNYLLALIKSQIENRSRLQKQIRNVLEPQEFDDSGITSKDAAFMRRLYSEMNSVLSNEDIDISSFAERMGVSRTKFYYKIKSLTGESPSEFLMHYRLNVAAKMLKEGNKNISEVAYAVGFSTLSHFSRSFKKQFGISPSKYN